MRLKQEMETAATKIMSEVSPDSKERMEMAAKYHVLRSLEKMQKLFKDTSVSKYDKEVYKKLTKCVFDYVIQSVPTRSFEQMEMELPNG